jgi:hypothetical protein
MQLYRHIDLIAQKAGRACDWRDRPRPQMKTYSSCVLVPFPKFRYFFLALHGFVAQRDATLFNWLDCSIQFFGW